MAMEERKLSALSLGGKDRLVMRSLLNLANGRSQGTRWVMTDAPGGEVTVVDVDSKPGQQYWKEQVFSAGISIAFTRDKSFDAELLLLKPLRSREFLKLLDLIASGMDPDAVAAALQAQMGKKPRLEKPELETPVGVAARTLADHLRQQTWMTPIALTHVGWPMLLIDPGSGAWFFDGSISDLEPDEFARPIPESAGVPLSSTELVERIGGHRQRPLSELKWFAGLAQMPGKLHPELRGDVQFMLAQIPAESMQHPKLHQLAQIVLRGPITLADLVEQSGQLEANVMAFLNACFASGKLLINRDWRAAGF